jgi:YHS domain-containing protein
VLKDPVCGKRLHRGKAYAIAGHEGVNYFLCCPRCQAEFERSPRTYARPELGEKVKNERHLPYRKQPV